MLTHINQQSSAVMVELIAALAPKFLIVAIDYPSHGMSDHIDWQPAIEDYARAALDVMDALKVERFHAMGEAVGAATSLALAANHAARIDKVVLINTPYFTDAVNAKTDIADIQRVRPTDATGFPAPRSIEYLLTNDPEHAPMEPTQDWMGPHQRRAVPGRPRPLAGDGRAVEIRYLGHGGTGQAADPDALRRALHLRQASRAGERQDRRCPS
jgi:pimeloyl-ACP methyl ester carboxylesterase